MKFTEALTVLRKKPISAPAFTVQLACGFTPLHLKTFLEAHLQLSFSDRTINIVTGLFGDLIGSVESLAGSDFHAAAVAIEWPDLDPRLSFRNAAGWSPSDIADTPDTVGRALNRLERALQAAPPGLRIALSMPTLTMPPVFHTAPWQSAETELCLVELVAAAQSRIAGLSNISVLRSRRLDELSPLDNRSDLKADLFAGLPYTMPHASTLAAALAELIHPPAPMKGLITDLDDTLWKGILGDIGVDNIAWDLDSHARAHGLYQQLLHALADQGTLIGCASKNEPGIVERALARPDILLPLDKLFPVVAHWGAKSESVARILNIWNVGAESVVFVDDSPMELDEVGRSCPGIHCLRFPKDDYAAMALFLRDLRGWFGKARLTGEDALRRESIRKGAEFQRLSGESSSAPEDFLASMQPRLNFDLKNATADPRVLELVNKTNQFNLNGIRYSEADWLSLIAMPGSFVASITYEDRFGPLGKIAAVAGTVDGDTLRVTVWVMSCRAFARRIEHKCLSILFDHFGVEAIEFCFSETPSNGPLRDFFRLFAGEPLPNPVRLERVLFESQCPVLYHNLSKSL